MFSLKSALSLVVVGMCLVSSSSAYSSTGRVDFYDVASQPGERLLRMGDDSRLPIHCIGVRNTCIRVERTKSGEPIFTQKFSDALKEARHSAGDSRRRVFCVSEKVKSQQEQGFADIKCFYYQASQRTGEGRKLKFKDFNFLQVTYVEDPQSFPSKKEGDVLKLAVVDPQTGSKSERPFHFRLDAF